MLLAIDVGNTNITIGLFDDDNLILFSRMATNADKMDDEYAIELREICRIHDVDISLINGCIISSVVPKVTGRLFRAVKTICEIDSYILSSKLVPGLKVRNGDTSSLGADIIAGIYAAKNIYGYPCIVIDMGTATTIFAVDKDGVVAGGSILPGLLTSLDALTMRTAQLPSISLEAPDKAMGCDTVSCMQSGLILGTASTIDGLTERFEEELGYKCKIIATGGLSKVVINSCRRKVIFDDALLLTGLRHIFLDNNV
jgi:type III pantothenate kinase